MILGEPMDGEGETNGIFKITLGWIRSNLTEVNCSFIPSICRSIIIGDSPRQGRDGSCAMYAEWMWLTSLSWIPVFPRNLALIRPAKCIPGSDIADDLQWIRGPSETDLWAQSTSPHPLGNISEDKTRKWKGWKVPKTVGADLQREKLVSSGVRRLVFAQ